MGAHSNISTKALTPFDKSRSRAKIHPMKVIGLAGKSGSGKDLIADYLGERYNYRKIAVADAIRDEVSEFISMALLGETVHRPDIIPIEFKPVWEAYRKSVWAKPTSPEMRVLLQWWGTEYRRNQDSNYWTERLAERIANSLENLVISDIRTPEEVAVVREAGGEVWFVLRPGIQSVGIPNHLTEVALEGFKFDLDILNDGTIEDLYQTVDEVLVPSNR